MIKASCFNSILTERYRNPTEGSWEFFKKPTSAVLFSDYQTLANYTPGWKQYCFGQQPYCLFLPSLQAILILKIRVARTLDQFLGPQVLRNLLFRSFSSFLNFSAAWVRPWRCQISGHRIFQKLSPWGNKAACISFILAGRYQNPTEGCWEILE